MSNPGGGNQFGNYTLQPQYGDVKKQTQLTREAPISGSPFAQQALGAPRRAQKRAAGVGSPTPGPAPEVLAAPVTPTAGLWQQIAAAPGASPLVISYAARAAAQ